MVSGNTNTKRIELRLSVEIVKALDDYCEERFVSRSWVLSRVLRRLLPAIPGNSVNLIDSLILTGGTPAHTRQPPGNHPATTRPPDPGPARAGTDSSQNKNIEEYIDSGKLTGFQEPKGDTQKITSELVSVLNRIGQTSHRPESPDNSRAVWGRLTGATDGQAATADQMRKVVHHCAREWAGTKWAPGLKLTTLLGRKFWDYLATADVPTSGGSEAKRKDTAAARQAADEARKRREAARAAADRARRGPAEGAGPEAFSGPLRATMANLGSMFDPESEGK